MDELRHGIIHGDGLQKVGLKDGVEPCSFSMKPLTPPCAPLLLHTRYRFLAAQESSSPLVVQAPPSSVAGPVDLVITQPDGETELVRLL